MFGSRMGAQKNLRRHQSTGNPIASFGDVLLTARSQEKRMHSETALPSPDRVPGVGDAMTGAPPGTVAQIDTILARSGMTVCELDQRIRLLANALVSRVPQERREEVADEVIFEVWTAILDKKVNWPDEMSPSESRSFAFGIVRNKFVNLTRKWARRHLLLVPFAEGSEPIDRSRLPRSPESEEIARKMREQIERLPERQQSIIRLDYYEGLSNEAIGRRLGISLGTVKSAKHRALKQLHQAMVGSTLLGNPQTPPGASAISSPTAEEIGS